MGAAKSTLRGMRITTANGLTMYTRISSELMPVPTANIVLVHGLSVSSGYMIPTAVRLASSYRVWVPDLPGFGRSEKPPRILTVPELTDALVAWMEAVELSSAIFVGNSLGCQIIVNLAMRYPERVENAILVSPTMDPKAHTVHQQIVRLLRDVRYEPFHFLPVLLREYLVAGIPRTIRTLRYAFEDLIEEKLPQVYVPTLVVRGTRDPIVPQEWAEKVHQLIPGSQFVTIQGAGHAVNLNHPAHLVALIRSFLTDASYPQKGKRIKSSADYNVAQNMLTAE